MVNKTNDMKEYKRLYYQKKKEENPEKVREYERNRSAQRRARLREAGLPTNNYNNKKEYMRLYYQKRKEENPEKRKEYERIKKAEYRARLRGMGIFIDTDPSIFLIKCFRNNP